MQFTQRCLVQAAVLVVAIAGAAPAARAQNAASPAPAATAVPMKPAHETAMDRSYDGNWHTTIAPYVWAPTVKTNIQFAIPALHVPGNGVFSESLKIKPNDYLSKINAGALFSVDARKGPLYVFGDFIYLNATANLNASGTIPVPHSAVDAPFYVTTSTRLSQRIWELAAGFSLFHGRNGDLNLFGGWRDFPIDTTVGYTAVVGSKGQLSTSGTITSKVSAGDVIFGLRGKTYLGDGHWYVPYYLDMGVGSNNQSWQGFTGAGYVFDHGQTLTLGYRTLNYNRKHVVQYINTDQLTTGDPFVVSASPGLYAFMKQICDIVPAADGKTMLGTRDQRKDPLLNPIGGGSDHQNFAYMLGVLSTSNGYYGPFGAHHTAEDNLDGLRTYDPGMREAVITAQVTGIQAMRAANATVTPLRIEEIPTQLLKDLLPLQLAAFAASEGKVTLGELRGALLAYRDAAHATDVAMLQAETKGDVAAMQQLAAKEQAARDAFYLPDGLLENAYYHTIDRVYTSFPEIVYDGNKPDVAAKAVQRALLAIQTATTALQ